MQYQLPHHCIYACFQTSWAGNTDPVLLFSVQHSAQKHSHVERMLMCDSVRQTRELTYMTGQASACSHPWKFTTWRFKCRRHIVSSKWRRLSRKEEGHSGNVGLGLYLQRLEVLHGYVSQYRRGIWCKNSFKISMLLSLSLSVSHTHTHTHTHPPPHAKSAPWMGLGIDLWGLVQNENNENIGPLFKQLFRISEH